MKLIKTLKAPVISTWWGSVEITFVSLNKRQRKYLNNFVRRNKDVMTKKTVLDLVVQELGETSKKLRSQVMPYARLIINQILPILTDGRYSEFEITEDLKFKAHSTISPNPSTANTWPSLSASTSQRTGPQFN